jgi:S1-C subfamily serine protease
MDEQTPHSRPERDLSQHLAKYGAPVPPPPGAQAMPAAPPAAPRRRRPRLLAAGAALAVVAAAGGAGFALGHLDHEDHPAADGPSSRYRGQVPDQQGSGDRGSHNPFGAMPFDGSGSPGQSPYGGSGGQGESPYDSTAGAPATDTQLTGLVKIASTLKYAGGRAAGTGMILTSTGEVVTNHHVVEGSTKLRVTVMTTGRSYDASVVGTDAKDDVAVLQLDDASGLQTVTTDNDAVSVGDAVTAVGDANGASSFSAATGKVLAMGQHITTSSEHGGAGERLRGLIEISSDVIPGDSGGATYDDEGEVLGMTTAASSGGSDVVGYAIPIAKVVRIAGDLENGTQNARYEYGSPAFLGIGLTGTVTQIGQVYAGTPAARAGIGTGDAITRVGTTRVSTAAQLRDAVRAYSPGDRVRLAWTDAGGTAHVGAVTLIAGPIA